MIKFLRRVFAYIRVSTAKQGEKGVSLQEQRDAIKRYAERNSLEIVAWFEETETAAKRGRPVFNRMLKFLRQGKADGAVLHKIDRGARNLKDWADLAELIDAGIEVHFANESLDMKSRGGRLSADIQAVVAADYIRNLRDETKKGFYGRLKQGIYPLPAPIGYVDKGAGKPKEPDPAMAPLVRRAFELYETGRHNLDSLGQELHRIGLRNRTGGTVTRTGLSTMLNNPFYVGLIRIERTAETFLGIHQPLVPKSLFDRVGTLLRGKVCTRNYRHDFLFRRLLACANCDFSLIGELQKGHVYYRCHTKDCWTTGIREEAVGAELTPLLQSLCFNEEERDYFQTKILKMREDWVNERQNQEQALKMKAGQLTDRLNRLTDAFIDGAIEKDLFESRKTALLMEQKAIEENMANLRAGGETVPDRLSEFLELAGSAWLSYEMGLPNEKRELVRKVTSNRRVDGKKLEIEPSIPFGEIAKRFKNSDSPPQRDIPRTWDRLLGILTAACTRGQLPVLKRTLDCEEDDISTVDSRKEGDFAKFGKN
jgi:DNA invertase Pin-like site-specific DNA recombinase